MSAGEMLSKTFSLIKTRFETYLGLVAICLAITSIGLLVFFLMIAIGPDGVRIGLVIAVLLAFVMHSILYGGLAKLASEQIIGQRISLGEAWRFAISKAWLFIIAAVLFVVFGIVGLILLIIPGIYIMVSLALINQAIVIEGYGLGEALKRSHSLIKGSWWRCFWILLQVFLIQSAMTELVWGMLSYGLSIDRPSLLYSITKFGISFLVAPIWVVATTLLFYDLRDRKNNLESPAVADSLTENNNSTVSEQ